MASTSTGTDRLEMAAKRPEADPRITPGATICDTPEAIERFRVITCLQGLRLEAQGIRIGRVSCLSVARRDYGIRARTAKVAAARLEAVLRIRGIIQ